MKNNMIRNKILMFRKLISLLKSSVYIKALIKGVAASVEHENTFRGLKTNFRTVIDIGANRGQFAIFCRKNFPYSKIFSFEPLIEPLLKYKKIFNKDRNVSYYAFAIGPEKCESLIHISNRDDSSSLYPISNAQVNYFPKTFEKKARLIQMSPLKNFLSIEDIISPSLLKIDVQGFELSVLKGCTPLISSFRYIYVECSFIELYIGQSYASDIIKYLFDYGFILIGVYNIFYDNDGKAIQADFLFTQCDRKTS